jgi:hypothetical protein
VRAVHDVPFVDVIALPGVVEELSNATKIPFAKSTERQALAAGATLLVHVSPSGDVTICVVPDAVSNATATYKPAPYVMP